MRCFLGGNSERFGWVLVAERKKTKIVSDIKKLLTATARSGSLVVLCGGLDATPTLHAFHPSSLAVPLPS